MKATNNAKPNNGNNNPQIPYVNTSGARKGMAALPVGLDPDETFSTATPERRGMGGRMSIQRYAVAFLHAMERNYKPITRENLMRRYKRMDRDCEMLYKQGILSTLSPKNMLPEDICNYLVYRSNIGNSDSEMIHEISSVVKLFDYIGNPAARECLAKYPYLKPKKSTERLPSMDPAVVDMIYAKAMEVPQTDWISMVSYGLAVFAVSTGMRNKELRLCDIRDINAENAQWVVTVKHPKGEGTYGKERPVPVDPRAYPFLKRYFIARMKFVNERGSVSNALFPGGYSDGGYLSSNAVREYCSRVSKDLGVEFNLRDCRRTYGQNLLDMDADIETVSKLLGHASTATTEGYYCSIRQSVAVEKASKIYSFQPVSGARTVVGQLPKGFDITVISNPEEEVN